MRALYGVFSKWSPLVRRLAVGSIAAFALAAVIFAVVAVRADAIAEDKVSAAQEGRAFVVDIVPQLLSYDYDTVEQHFADLDEKLSGDFRAQFDEVGKTVIVPSARERQVVTTAEVIESSVVESDVDSGEFLLFLNQSTTSAESPETKLDGSRVRVNVERTDGTWLITELTPV